MSALSLKSPLTVTIITALIYLLIGSSSALAKKDESRERLRCREGNSVARLVVKHRERTRGDVDNPDDQRMRSRMDLWLFPGTEVFQEGADVASYVVEATISRGEDSPIVCTLDFLKIDDEGRARYRARSRVRIKNGETKKQRVKNGTCLTDGEEGVPNLNSGDISNISITNVSGGDDIVSCDL